MVSEELIVEGQQQDDGIALPFGVPECFAGKSVFVTGASGFMGKVLLEKLLRSCPQIDTIYILLRPKRGRGLDERMEAMSALPLFDKLHKMYPGHFKSKMVAVNGDVTALGLGLSPQDRHLLVERVNYVFHVAATVKFDQPLKDAIIMNTRGTREVCRLALDMKHIHLMVHVSTAYAHTKNDLIEEKLYPAEADWRKTIECAERTDRHQLQVVMPHFMEGFPNTYTFTKGLAEQVAFDLLDGVVPCVILRPSIVISSWKEPVSGWIDNFNGPVSLLAANGTGLVRINYLKDIYADFVPVDLAIKALINAVWFKLVHMQDRDYQLKTTAHNISANGKSVLTSKQVAQMAYGLSDHTALSTCVWYPTLRSTENLTIFWLYTMILHVIPAMFLDAILRLLNHKPIVLMIQRRIFVAVNALKYFMTRSWVIHNHTLYDVEHFLPDKDVAAFGYDADSVDYQEYFRGALLGGMQYLLKEDMTKLESNKKRLKVFKIVDTVVEIAWYAWLFYLIVLKWNVFGSLGNSFANYWEALN